jgi:hypothetical protein
MYALLWPQRCRDLFLISIRKEGLVGVQDTIAGDPFGYSRHTCSGLLESISKVSGMAVWIDCPFRVMKFLKKLNY